MNHSPFHVKRKMQDVSFRNVEECLEYLPADELEVVDKLRSLIFQAIPDIHEKLAYNVPFYKRHANICFIWPAAIPWGKLNQKGVRLGFSQGYLLEDKEGFLEKGDRKQVYTKDFMSAMDMDETLLLTFLLKAAALDEETYRSKKKLNLPHPR